MTTTDTVQLVHDQCTWIVPPNIQSMMTGVRHAKIFPNNKVTLTYTDGKEESAILSQAELATTTDNFFELVGIVQAKR